jgi:Tfp pilus assembly protein FimT
VNNLISEIWYARSEAVQRGGKVILCASDNAQSCHGFWNDGQIVIEAKNRKVLQAFKLAHGEHLVWRSSFGWNDNITFLPSGFTNGQRGSFYLTSPHHAPARIIIESSGRIRVAGSH